VITDPYEYPRMLPQMPSGEPRNLLWFGHWTNLDGLEEILPKLEKYNVMAVSAGNIPKGAKPMQWSREGMMLAFSWSDVVIIPISGKQKNVVKSPNRMVEAIRQGRYVVANPLESYTQYGMWQGDIVEGLEWAKKNPEEVFSLVAKAQALVEEIHSPSVVGKQWYELLKAA